MANSIAIPYLINDQDVLIKISYQIVLADNIHTITCKVHANNAYAHNWLQIRKFELRSILSDGIYIQLFNENDHVYSVKANLFIEEAYQLIMEQESCKMATV